MALSRNNVLAVGFGIGGMRMFALGAFLDAPGVHKHVSLELKLPSSPVAMSVFWIGDSLDERALVVYGVKEIGDVLSVGGSYSSNAAYRGMAVLFAAPHNVCVAVDACVPGVIGLITHDSLHVFTLDAQQTFQRRKIDMSQLDDFRITHTEFVPTALVVSRSCIALASYSKSRRASIVEVLDAPSGNMRARRLLPAHKCPRLSVDDDNVAVTTPRSVIMFNADREDNHNIGHSGDRARFWPLGTRLNGVGWTLVRVDADSDQTVLERVAVPR